MSDERHGASGAAAPEAELEWLSPIGAVELAWLAWPWRRTERAARQPGDRLELFRVHQGSEVALARIHDLRGTLAGAAARLQDALTASASSLAIEAMLQPLTGSEDTPIGLHDLLRRAAAPARVETHIIDRAVIVTDIAADGPTSTRLLADAPVAAIELHRRAVAAALSTRVTLVHAARTTLTVAATLVALAGTGTAALAMPFAWRFVHNILKEHSVAQGH